MDPILVVGHDDKQAKQIIQDIRKIIDDVRIVHISRPPDEYEVVDNNFRVMLPRSGKDPVPIGGVIFHGIFPDDENFLRSLCLSHTPCFPSPVPVLRCRNRLNALLDALSITGFNDLSRSLITRGSFLLKDTVSVMKSPSWRVDRLDANRETSGRIISPGTSCPIQFEPTLFEEYRGGATIQVICFESSHWRCKSVLMGGMHTNRSASHPDSVIYNNLNANVLKDANVISSHFNARLFSVDYVLDVTGDVNLIEVNAMPDVYQFDVLWQEYLELVRHWLQSDVVDL